MENDSSNFDSININFRNFSFVGGVIGWLAKEQSYQNNYTTFTTHPEMFDAKWECSS